MSESDDVRWRQRLANFRRAHAQLEGALVLRAERELSDLEKQGTIQAFEFTYELAWNLLRDYLAWQGAELISGSRDTIREAFRLGLVSDGHAWMAMLQDRNRTVHTYNEATANEILEHLGSRYAQLFEELDTIFAVLEAKLNQPPQDEL